MNLDKLYSRGQAATLREQINAYYNPWFCFSRPEVNHVGLPPDCGFLKAFEEECRMLLWHAVLYQLGNSWETTPMIVEFPVQGIHNSMEVSIKSTARILTSEEGGVSLNDCIEIIQLRVIDMPEPTDLRAFEKGSVLLKRVVDLLPTSAMFHRPFVTVLTELCGNLESQGYETVRTTWDQATLAITYQRGTRLWLINVDVDGMVIDYDHLKATLNPPKDV